MEPTHSVETLKVADSSLIFSNRPPYMTPLKGRLLALPPNIRLGWKWLPVTKAIAYINAVLITTAKSFIVQVYVLILGIVFFKKYSIIF